MSESEPPHIVSPEALRERMELIHVTLKSLLPPEYFFFFLMGPLGSDFDGKQANYTSNADRTAVIKVMKEFIIRNGSEEEWMRHIE